LQLEIAGGPALERLAFATAACCAVQSSVPSPPMLTIKRVPLSSLLSTPGPGGSSAVAQ
jgi:hypothetical protein